MNTKVLSDVIELAKAWPDSDQEELPEYAREIEARRRGEVYQAAPEELEGIDRELRAAQEGRFATDERVTALFAKFHRGQ
jgi:hypothetical protein